MRILKIKILSIKSFYVKVLTIGSTYNIFDIAIISLKDRREIGITQTLKQKKKNCLF